MTFRHIAVLAMGTGIIMPFLLAQAAAPVPVKGEVARALVINDIGPPCNMYFSRMHAHSQWREEFTVTTAGKVVDLKETKLAESAIQSSGAQNFGIWQFKPYLMNGVPTPMRVVVRVQCGMEGEPSVVFLDK